jgi:hypothetical protein
MFGANRIWLVMLALALCGCDPRSQAVVEVAGKGLDLVNEKPEQPPADAQTITVTITAELQPNQLEESVDVEFHLRGGGLRADTQVASAKLQHTREAPRKVAKFTLKAGYAYRYKVEGRTLLRLNGRPVVATGSGSGTLTFNEGEADIRLGADTSESRIYPDGQGNLTMQYKPFIEAAAADAKKPSSFEDAAVNGTAEGSLVLRTPEPLAKGVTAAYVEVDGRRACEWPLNSQELTLAVPTGAHQVIVRSKMGKKYFKKEFDNPIYVPSGGKIELNVQSVVQDSGAKW